MNIGDGDLIWVISRHVLVGKEENQDKTCQINRSATGDFKSGPPKYEAGM